MRRRYPGLFALVSLLAVLVAPSAALGQAPPDYERWYGIYIRGQKAGHAVMSQATGADGNITTSSVMDFEIARSRISTTMEMVQKQVETPEGEMARVEFAQRLGTGTSVESTYLFEDGKIVKVSRHMGDERRTTREPFELAYMTPTESRSYIVNRIDERAEEFRYETLDASSGLRVTQTVVKVVGPERIESYGQPTVALKTTSVNSLTPGVEVTEWLDEQGVALKMRMKMGAFPFELVAMTKADAMADEAGGADAELFTPTLVKVDPPVESPREVTSATLRLKVEEGRLPDFLDGGIYTFERIDERTGRVTIDIDDPAPAPGKDISDTRYIKPTVYANTEDTQIIRLAQRAISGVDDADDLARAEAMRRFVYEFVDSKNLSTGFATASEVCRTGEGDCSEHAVLLAALLRAQRIPSRVVSGLIYADSFAGEASVFGFHMWTQALVTVDGKPTWVDVDAVLPEGSRMDAMHIAVSTFDLTEDEMAGAMTPIMSLLGNLSVEVESISRD